MTNFLRDRRIQFRLSQAQLAEALGVSQQTVARWESSGQIPAKYLIDLAVALGARAQDFLPGATPAKKLVNDGEQGEATEAADDIPFGDLFISYVGEAEPRRYPVSERTMQQIQEVLGDVGHGDEATPSWVRFETLNNKWVVINSAHVERLAFVDDNVVAMTAFFHVEVYKAARVLHADMPDPSRIVADDFPYTEKTLAEVAALLEPMGEHAIFELDGITCEYASGIVTRNLLGLAAATALDDTFNAGYPRDLRSGSYLTLHDPDNATYEHLRLGALRSIEVSLLAFDEVME